MPQLYLKEVQPFIVAPDQGKRSSPRGIRQTKASGGGVGEQKLFSRNTTKRNTSLVATDALLLCLEFFQVLAVLQAMSLKWIWPRVWISRTNFIFLFTADAWEYIKVDCGAFLGVRNYDTSSATVTTKFYYILAGWGGFFALTAAIWVGIKMGLRIRQPAYYLMHNARLQRAVIIITQIIALPFGVTAFKVFHCTSDGKMSVENTVECWSGLHWAYAVPVLVAAAVLYVIFPVWLVRRIRHVSMASADQHHEDFIKLKEVEYMSGLDVVWAVRGLHLFSSFRLRALYYRPAAHLVKLIVLILYATTFQSARAQAISMAVLLGLVALVGLALRPYRLIIFNVVLVFGYFCLTGSALFGAVITQFNPTQMESPWLVEPYSVWILSALNGVLLTGMTVVFVIYLLVYRLFCQGRFILEPLWPVMTAYEYDVEGVETQKYLAAVLRGRAVIEQCRRLPAMFTPVHEMAHQIRVLNAFMRESELLCDGLHPTLWAVLDEMIDMHHRLEPRSLFGEMVQDSIRKNAAHFMTLMPMFAQRLAQRDYDLILVSPLKKRLLFKMYIIAMLRDGSGRRKTHHQLTQKVLTSIWEDSADVVEVTEQREYHEELYPDFIQGPDTEALYRTGTLDLGRGLYDLEAAEDEEESLSSFLKRAPPQLSLMEEALRPESSLSQQNTLIGDTGTDNPAFTTDESTDNTSSQANSGSRELTTTDVNDTSEAPPDVLVDLEIVPRPEHLHEGDTTVDLPDFPSGESSTDAVAHDEGKDGRREERRERGSSVTSTTTTSSSSSHKSGKGGQPNSESSDRPTSAGELSSASAKSKSSDRGAAATSAKPKVKVAVGRGGKGGAGKKSAKRN